MSQTKDRPGLSVAKRNIFLLSVVIDSLGSGMWMPFAIIFFTRSQGMDLGDTGLAMTIGAFVGLMAGFASGHVADRYGAGLVAISSHVVRVLAFAAYPFVESPWQITVVVAVTACGERMLWTANTPMISSIFRGRNVDNILGFAGVLGIMGLGVGAGIAGLLADSVSGLRLIAWLNSASFAITGVLLVIALGSRLLDRPAVASTIDGLTSVGSVWRNRPYLQLCLIQILFVLAASSYVMILPLVIIDVLHGPAWLPAASIVIGNVAIAVAQRPVLKVSRRLPRSRMLFVSVGLYAVSLLLLVPGDLFGAILIVPVVALVVVIGGVAEATATPLMLSAANEAAPEGQKGRYSAVFQTAWGVAEVAGPLVYTTLLAVGNAVLWLSVTAAVLLVAPMLLRVRPMLPPKVLLEAPTAS
ncbi:MFS transporter [Actinoplanes derwentensis]|uniref:MFS transporter n=1 Tax=Actinoplanes derwentensis TaxID=113562 RepID=UPI0023B2A78B|nr:MFS transporter [Actinoplanes derwentensis]